MKPWYSFTRAIPGPPDFRKRPGDGPSGPSETTCCQTRSEEGGEGQIVKREALMNKPSLGLHQIQAGQKDFDTVL